MFTKIHNKNGQEMSIVSQQYDTGVHVIINDDPKQQFGVIGKEEDFHKKVRIKAIKNGDILINGTYIPYNSKKYNINNFKKD
jgi:hypothetical protein